MIAGSTFNLKKMLWLPSLWRPPDQVADEGRSAVAVKLTVLTYLVLWVALGIALYMNWSEWPAYLKYSLAFVEALFGPDLKGIRDTFR